MPKPKEINVAMLAKQRDGTYALDLIETEDPDVTHRFRLSPEAVLEMADDIKQNRSVKVPSSLNEGRLVTVQLLLNGTNESALADEVSEWLRSWRLDKASSLEDWSYKPDGENYLSPSNEKTVVFIPDEFEPDDSFEHRLYRKGSHQQDPVRGLVD